MMFPIRQSLLKIITARLERYFSGEYCAGLVPGPPPGESFIVKLQYN